MRKSRTLKIFKIVLSIIVIVSCDNDMNTSLPILSNFDEYPTIKALRNISKNNLSIAFTDFKDFEYFKKDVQSILSITLDSKDIILLEKIYKKYKISYEDAILKKFGIWVNRHGNLIYDSIMYKYVVNRFGSSVINKIINDIDSIYSIFLNEGIYCLKEGTFNSILNKKDYIFQLDDIFNFDININLPMYSKGFDSLISIEIPFINDNVNEINDGLIVNFIVNSKGAIKDIWVSSKLSKIHDSIACDIIKKMGRWNPAVYNKKKVNYMVSLTIDFIPKNMIENERYRLQKRYKKMVILDSSFKHNKLKGVPFW